MSVYKKNTPLSKSNNKSSVDKGAIFVVLLYMILFFLVTEFHEPWFDEAQAWEIGRTATYKDLFTVITHTEGHPPLWSFILSIPARLGVPYFIGLKGTSFIFSFSAVFLIAFKSPYPKAVKYLLPFSYFIFYQYGIISRTYCVMEFTLIMIAMLYKERRLKPWSFIGSLYLLCLTSIYGILIATGICVCIVWELFSEYRNKGFYLVFKDRMTSSLLILLLAVLPVVFLITPPVNAYAMDQISYEYLLRKIFYFFMVMPGDTFISVTGIPIWDSMDITYVLPGLIVTLIMFFIIWMVSNKKDIKYYAVPYFFYAFFMCFYGSGNHTGIGMIWFLSYIWAVYDEKCLKQKWDKAERIIIRNIDNSSASRLINIIKLIPVVILGFSVIFCFKISIDDIMLPYSESKQIADFIKEHHMENANIMVKWDMQRDSSDDKSVLFDSRLLDSAYTFDAVAILPYFDNNIFFNHNINDHEKGYLTHLKSSLEENNKTYKMWREYGIPEVLVGLPALSIVYDDEVSINDYVSVATIKGYYMGKNKTMTMNRQIYVRRDCLGKFGLSDYDI